jgi:alanine dehydrogenase
MKRNDDLLKSLTQQAMMPQESMLEVGRKKSSLFIGIPKETAFQENRVALVPNAVSLLINLGHQVVIESNAGQKSHFVDRDYSEAGAQIVYSVEEVYKADLILKVAPPTLSEIDLMKQGQSLLSALQLNTQPESFLKKLVQKRITAVAFDFIQDEDGIYPIVRAMSEIAGNTSVLIASELLSNTRGGQGTMLGGIAGVAPTEIVILGAGTVGEFATRAALGLGASVKVFDNSVYKLRRLQNDIGRELYTSILQPEVLKKALKNADVVIGSLRAKKGRTPCVVSEDMVSEMKHGSVVIDVSIDQGGCFETSKLTNHKEPTFTHYGVIHYCVPNIASRVSRTASYALSNNFAPLLSDAGEYGGFDKMLRDNIGVRNGVYIYKGCVTNQYLAETFGLPFKDLDLLMAAF